MFGSQRSLSTMIAVSNNWSLMLLPAVRGRSATRRMHPIDCAMRCASIQFYRDIDDVQAEIQAAHFLHF